MLLTFFPVTYTPISDENERSQKKATFKPYEKDLNLPTRGFKKSPYAVNQSKKRQSSFT